MSGRGLILETSLFIWRRTNSGYKFICPETGEERLSRNVTSVINNLDKEAPIEDIEHETKMECLDYLSRKGRPPEKGE